MNFIKTNKFKFIIISLHIIYAALIYLPITSIEINIIDKRELVTPFERVHSFNDYIDAIKSGEILDIQPVRDLFHIIDRKLSSMTGLISFGILTNFILLLLIYWQLCKTFYLLFGSSFWYLLIIVFTHPLYFYIFIEETSKKHILSFLFSITAFNLFLKNKKKVALCFYTLGCLSHPVSIYLAPFLTAFIYQSGEKIQSIIKKLLPLYIVTFIITILNLFYYQYYYPSLRGINKSLPGFNIGETLLYIGRYIDQFFYPYNMSMFYANTGITQLIGLISVFLMVYITYKKYKKSFFIWVPFFTVMLILYHKKIDIPYLNTYSLVPNLSLLLFLSLIINKYKKYSLAIVLTVSFLFSIKTYKEKELRIDSIALAKHIYQNQPSCRSLTSLVFNLSQKLGTKDEINKYGQEWVNSKCRIFDLKGPYINTYLLTFFIYSSNEMSVQEKVNLYQKRISSKHDIAILKEATKSAHEISYRPQTNFDQFEHKSLFANSIISQELLNHCEKINNESCKSFKRYLKRVQDKNILFKEKKAPQLIEEPYKK